MLAMTFVADPAFHVRQSSQYLEAFCDLAIWRSAELQQATP